MASSQKRKGNRYERELVETLQERGFKAERARGSDGRALGEAQEVDLVMYGSNEERVRIQAKIRAKIASYLKIPEGCDVVMVREDYGETLVVVPLDTFLDML